MISYEDALATLLAETQPLDTERVAIADALGRVLASDIASTMRLPAFDNAAMDGYALRAGTAALSKGSIHTVRGMQAAGDVTLEQTGADSCEIATGARMPDGFDTVVPVERIEREGDTIRLLDDTVRGQHVRKAGDDIAHDEPALPAGRKIDAAALMLLAALGIDEATVRRQPRVAIICTGKELHAGAGILTPGSIHNSNGPFLRAALTSCGAHVVQCDTVGDDVIPFGASLARALDRHVDLVVTTGAVSAGRYDFLPAAMAALGARTLFHKVAIRPGKPLLAARLANGPLLMALPGNPMAVAVGMRFFVAPLIRTMLGLSSERPLRVLSDETPDLREGLRHFVLANLFSDDGARLRARPVGRQTAYRMLPFTQAQVWLSLSSADGNMADAYPLDAGHSP
ncbi:molybdopterin molybdotransferase MoeA [Luteibacter rhizovicinus]|nr:molybdopterin molybdotransferase MoeA [Luteibacter rhizovicinus]